MRASALCRILRCVPPLLLALLSGPGAGSAVAQEALTAFDAAVVAFPNTTAVVRTGDFDGNGTVDGIGWYWVDDSYHQVRVSLFFGAGDGTFTAGPWFHQYGISGSATTWGLEVGRFDRNGRDDFASAFDKGVVVMTSDATGAPVPYASWNEAASVLGMAVADFDGNGLDDLALAVAGSGVRLYANTGAGFALAGTFTAGSDLRCGRFDAAAGDDLAVIAGGDVHVLSTAGGGLALMQTISHGLPQAQPVMLTAGDVDQDGDDDVVLFSPAGQYVVLRCLAGGFVKEPIAAGGPATALGDVDGDGDLDGICCGGSGGPTPLVNEIPSVFEYALNDGTGSFAAAEQMVGLGSLRIAGAVDVDGDGDNDLVAGRCVFFNRAGFAPRVQPRVVNGAINDLLVPRSRAAADRDGDGDPEMALIHYPSLNGVFRWQNDGSGAFALKTEPVPTPPGANLTGPWYELDYDGDGDVDRIGYQFVAFGGAFTGMLRLRNPGGGQFVADGFAAPAGVPFVLNPLFNNQGRGHAVGDFDQDGDVDVIAGGSSGVTQNPLWRNDGFGNFTMAGGTAAHWPIASADVDGDGKLDVFGGEYQVGIVFGDGAGGFTPALVLSVPFNAAFGHVAATDLDGDGRVDFAGVLASGSSAALRVVLQSAPRAFQTTDFPLPKTDEAQHVAGDDFDGDGDVDLVVGSIDESTGICRVFHNAGTGTFSSSIDQVLGSLRVFTDADGDADLDFVAAKNVFRNVRVDASTAGFRRQYGAAKPGLGGMWPTLGAVGPFAVNQIMELRVTGGRGGSVALLTVGLTEAAQANWPAFGVTGYTFPTFLAVLVPLGGIPGEAGTGSVTLPVVVPPAAAGGTFFHQAFIHDAQAKPGIWSHTNGLELRYP